MGRTVQSRLGGSDRARRPPHVVCQALSPWRGSASSCPAGPKRSPPARTPGAPASTWSCTRAQEPRSGIPILLEFGCL